MGAGSSSGVPVQNFAIVILENKDDGKILSVRRRDDKFVIEAVQGVPDASAAFQVLPASGCCIGFRSVLTGKVVTAENKWIHLYHNQIGGGWELWRPEGSLDDCVLKNQSWRDIILHVRVHVLSSPTDVINCEPRTEPLSSFLDLPIASEVVSLRSEITKLKSELASGAATQSAQQDEISALRKSSTETQEKLDRFADEGAQLKKKLEEEEEWIRSAKENFVKLNEEKSSLEEKNDQLNVQVQQLQEANENLEVSLRQREAMVQTLARTQEELAAATAKVGELQAVVTAKATIDDELSRARQRILELLGKVMMLEKREEERRLANGGSLPNSAPGSPSSPGKRGNDSDRGAESPTPRSEEGDDAKARRKSSLVETMKRTFSGRKLSLSRSGSSSLSLAGVAAGDEKASSTPAPASEADSAGDSGRRRAMTEYQSAAVEANA